MGGGIDAYVALSERGATLLPPRRAIVSAKVVQYEQILAASETTSHELNELVTRLETAKQRTALALDTLTSTIEALNGRNATLTEFVLIEKERETLAKSLSALQTFQERFVPQAADRLNLLGPDANPLTPLYIKTLHSLLQKKRNLSKIINFLSSADCSASVELDDALASVSDGGNCLGEIVTDSRGQILPFAVELEDVVEAALEKSFNAIQCFAQHVDASGGSSAAAFTQDAQTDEILKLAFTAEELEVPLRLKDHSDLICFYQSVALMRMRPKYFDQCIRAVSLFRGKRLTMTFLKDIAEGSPMIKGQTIMPRSLLLQAPHTFATHFANVLALLLQLIREEVAFAHLFWGEVVKFLSESNLMSRQSFLESVITHSVMREAHQILRAHIPFATRDIEGIPIDETPRRVKGDIVETFDLVYLLDVYSTLYSEVIQADQVPSIVKYLIHLREGFYYTFQQDLEERALSLQESFMDETASPTSRTPSVVIDAVNLVQQLLKVFDQHVLVMQKSSAGEAREDMKIVEFSQVLDGVFNPLINLLRHVSDKLPEDKAALLAINSYSYMLASLASPPVLQDWFPMHNLLSTLCVEAASAVANQQVLHILSKSGLDDSVSFPEFDLRNVSRVTALYQFSSSISSRGTLNLVMKVVSKTWRQRIKDDVLSRLANEYEELFKRIASETETSLRSPGEFRALLVGATTSLS